MTRLRPGSWLIKPVRQAEDFSREHEGAGSLFLTRGRMRLACGVKTEMWMKYLLGLLLFVSPLFASSSIPVLVVVTPPQVLLAAGQTQQLRAYAYYQDGTVTDMTTSGAVWSSLNTSVATVSSTGLVTMKTAGAVVIQAKVSFIAGFGSIQSAFTPFISVPLGNGSV